MISILVIDDDPELLEIICLKLGEYSEFSYRTCNSASCALKLTKKMKFDSVICDYYMPEMNGCSLMQLLRSRGCDAQLILYSARGPDDEIQNALASYMDVHIQRCGRPDEEMSELAALIHAASEKKTQSSMKT